MQYQLITVRYFSLDFTILPLNTLVRLNADCRIKPHAPPFIQTPANLFKFYLCSFTPQARYLRVNLHQNKLLSGISIDSGHELLGSPILIDTRALMIRHKKKMKSCRGIRKFLQSVGILSLNCTHC